jgi:hypothetical protein
MAHAMLTSPYHIDEVLKTIDAYKPISHRWST